MMKRKLISLLFILAMCAAMLLPVHASQEGFVFDFCGVFADTDSLDRQAQTIYEETGIALYFIITEDLNGMEPVEYVEQFSAAHGFFTDCVVLMEGPTSYYIRCFGRALEYITDEDRNEMMNVYAEDSSYTGGVQEYYRVALTALDAVFESESVSETEERELVLLTEAETEAATVNEPAFLVQGGEETSEHSHLLVDNGDLLTGTQEKLIAQRLDQVSKKHQMDVVIVTAKSLDGKDKVSYADDYFDYNGYGYGEEHDGLLLLYCPNEGVRYISTTGAAIKIFSGDGFTELTDAIIPYFDRGDVNGAFLAYADTCDKIIESANAFPWALLIIGLLIGAVLSYLIPMGMMKGELKTVRSQAAASGYVRAGSMNLTQNRDVFLFCNITRTEKPKNTSSGSTHTGSSGTSHGGGSF